MLLLRLQILMMRNGWKHLVNGWQLPVNEYLSAGTCTQYLSHVKEFYKKTFPNAPLFKRVNED